VILAHKAPRVSLVRLAFKALQVQKAIQVLPAFRVLLAQLVLLARQACQGLRGLVDTLERVLQGLLV
jgi:hypothetical protein